MNIATIVPWWAAIIGLLVAIGLILIKFNPTYSLFIGAIAGCLLGGESLVDTVTILTAGTSSIMGTAIRVLAAGFLAGVMMESGAAESIANAIVVKLGDRLAIFSLALSAMILTAVGVFIPVAVLIVAPIALAVGKRSNIGKLALLVALSGGGKAGNAISPNPNTIAAAGGFHVNLADVMIASFIPAVFGLAMAVLLATLLKNKGNRVAEHDLDGLAEEKNLMPLRKALIAPVLAIILLMVNPIGTMLGLKFLTNLKIDSLYILPFASIIGTIAMGRANKIIEYSTAGLKKIQDTVLILIGAGALAGLISASNLAKEVVSLIQHSGISGTFLAPLAAMLMSLAVGSTSTAVILTTGSFGKAILGTGTSALGAAVMVNAGGTVLDAVPQGNYFHITRDAMHLSIKDRMKVYPIESLVGFTTTVVATIMYGII